MLEQRRRLWKSTLRRVSEWASELAEKLRSKGVEVDAILLFGSIARGDYTEDSDVDLVVVSDDWARMSPVDRLSILYKIWDKPRDATFIPLTWKELEEMSDKSVVVREALSDCIVIYCKACWRREGSATTPCKAGEVNS